LITGTLHKRRAPSTEKVVEALRGGPLAFGQVMHETGLSRGAAHKALRRMMEEEVVVQATKRGPYTLHVDLLTSQDLEAVTGAAETKRLLLRLPAEGERISQIHGKRMRQYALQLFLRWNLSFMVAYMAQLFFDLNVHRSGSADERLLKKFMWTHLESWTGMLNSICFHNRLVLHQPVAALSKEFMELGTRSFAEYHKLLFPWTGQKWKSNAAF